MTSQAAEKIPDDVIPKPGAFWRAEESALFSAAGDKSRFLALLGMTANRSFSATWEAMPKNERRNSFPFCRRPECSDQRNDM